LVKVARMNGEKFALFPFLCKNQLNKVILYNFFPYPALSLLIKFEV